MTNDLHLLTNKATSYAILKNKQFTDYFTIIQTIVTTIFLKNNADYLL